jgi:hypothetical protein
VFPSRPRTPCILKLPRALCGAGRGKANCRLR